MAPDQRSPHSFLHAIRVCFWFTVAIFFLALGLTVLCFSPAEDKVANSIVLEATVKPATKSLWRVPDSAAIPRTEKGALILYGRELVAHTAKYLGPKGTVAQISNGMNCQNCHLEKGTKLFGNNYSAVASMYPRFRARSGQIETVEKRINDCLERSLNGKPLGKNSRELRAITEYLMWLGKDVEKGTRPAGVGLPELPFLPRAADPVKGRMIFEARCSECHGHNGEGVRNSDHVEWKYPPLWGPESYNVSAGLHRLSRFAGYVKANMPYGVTYDKPKLTDEEAWDVAAYVNTMPRPHKKFPEDWPDLTSKPFDHPFGPYADTFSEAQHKYGPFAPVKSATYKK
ncbi:MAG TPA: c-type cytochrome [Ohtaekwangia sp.]|nr:c-type cytochrome [Ohtaekwangia sp.]